MLEEPHGVHAEVFRMLRTNLEFANLDRGARTIMFTSAVEEEGKSTTVANLAVAIARAGHSVALVDLDLRRPFLARFFDLEEHPGLTDVALGHVDLQTALARRAIVEADGRPTLNGNGQAGVEGVLDILTSGPPPPDAGEFVGSGVLRNILDELREAADFVLIDVPPMLHVGDAMALAARVDALVVLTRLSVARRSMLNELRRLLDACPAAKLGFVVAGADLEHGYYGHGSGYYYTTERGREPERVR